MIHRQASRCSILSVILGILKPPMTAGSYISGDTALLTTSWFQVHKSPAAMLSEQDLKEPVADQFMERP